MHFTRHPSVDTGRAAARLDAGAARGLRRGLPAPAREYGIDFSHYKPNTVRGASIGGWRSIDHDLDDYVERLRNDPAELNSLYKDLLIGVTRFFRDPEAFERLEDEVIPELLAKVRPRMRSASGSPAARPAKRPIRWRFSFQEAARSRCNARSTSRYLPPTSTAARSKSASAGLYDEASVDGVCRAASSDTYPSGSRVPGLAGAAQDDRLCAAQHHQGRAVHQARPDHVAATC